MLTMPSYALNSISQKCKGMHSFHSKTHGKKTKREKITQDLRKAIHANLANGKKMYN